MKALHGDTRNKGKRKAAAETKAKPEVVAVVAEEGAPPASLTGRAAEIWRENFFLVKSQTFLKPVDHLAFADYCREMARFERLEKMIEDAGGEVITQPSGRLAAHPAVSMRDKALSNVMKLRQDLNLNPRSWIQSAATKDARQLILPGVTAPAPAAKEPAKPEDETASAPSSSGAGFEQFLAVNPNAAGKLH